MAAVTFTKDQVTRMNPWDGLNETVYDVYDVKLDGVLLKGHEYSFSVSMTDAEIQSAVESDLAAKGFEV